MIEPISSRAIKAEATGKRRPVQRGRRRRYPWADMEPGDYFTVACPLDQAHRTRSAIAAAASGYSAHHPGAYFSTHVLTNDQTQRAQVLCVRRQLGYIDIFDLRNDESQEDIYATDD